VSITPTVRPSSCVSPPRPHTMFPP
jgi:hypothetical protein